MNKIFDVEDCQCLTSNNRSTLILTCCDWLSQHHVLIGHRLSVLKHLYLNVHQELEKMGTVAGGLQ